MFLKIKFLKGETARLDELTLKGLLTPLKASFQVTSSEEKENGGLICQSLD